jgi:hypothetical protein
VAAVVAVQTQLLVLEALVEVVLAQLETTMLHRVLPLLVVAVAALEQIQVAVVAATAVLAS